MNDRYMSLRYEWVDENNCRTPEGYPYSYDPFFIFGNRSTTHGAMAEYSDRIVQRYGPDRVMEVAHRHGLAGRSRSMWSGANPLALSALISELHGKPYNVTAVAEGCNASNGYPYYIIWIKE